MQNVHGAHAALERPHRRDVCAPQDPSLQQPKKKDRFPLPIGPDASFAQRTHSQVSSISPWQRREASSRSTTPRESSSSRSAPTTPRYRYLTPRLLLDALLKAEIAGQPETSLELVLMRTSGQQREARTAIETRSEVAPNPDVEVKKRKPVKVKRQTPDTSHLDPWSLRELLRFGGSGSKRVIDSFREMDKDSSGELDKKEFADALRLMGFTNATQQEIDVVWTVCDTDGSGGIPYKELDTILRRLGPRRQLNIDTSSMSENCADLQPRPTRQQRRQRALIGAAMVLREYQVAPRGPSTAGAHLDVAHMRDLSVQRIRRQLGLPGRSEPRPSNRVARVPSSAVAGRAHTTQTLRV